MRLEDRNKIQEIIERDIKAEEVAAARLLIISPLLNTGLDRKGKRELCRKLIKEGWIHPQKGKCTLSMRTLWRWAQQFKGEGFDGLRPHKRKDSGKRRAIPEHVYQKAKELKEELPMRTVERVIELLQLRHGVSCRC